MVFDTLVGIFFLLSSNLTAPCCVLLLDLNILSEDESGVSMWVDLSSSPQRRPKNECVNSDTFTVVREDDEGGNSTFTVVREDKDEGCNSTYTVSSKDFPIPITVVKPNGAMTTTASLLSSVMRMISCSSDK